MVIVKIILTKGKYWSYWCQEELHLWQFPNAVLIKLKKQICQHILWYHRNYHYYKSLAEALPGCRQCFPSLRQCSPYLQSGLPFKRSCICDGDILIIILLKMMASTIMMMMTRMVAPGGGCAYGELRWEAEIQLDEHCRGSCICQRFIIIIMISIHWW